ncbi:hypothetical protein GCM10007859_07810 [Brevundimonas denitrificans]|uniref:Uncharacterized protein n=1 Tax=Brevundimonas denitrificans TaxID=1443434 RepID=A0ABQ6BFP7_9CAUL|nr:hypothetical protein [Brevundimonas denitrificans]GLS00773.1 hypothetical protein GCM10007859_07810 [Brevundimonas denitrificans]
MNDAGAARCRRIEQADRRRARAEKIETWLIVALAGLVLFKGAPVILGIALGIGEMMAALTRL